MARRVLITGAAGFIGGHLAHYCRKVGWKVTAIDSRAPAGERKADGLVRQDAGDPTLLKRIRSGEFDAVLHQAAITDTRETDCDALRSVNVDTSLALAKACALSGTRFVYASSGSVYGASSKRAALAECAIDDRETCSGPLTSYADSKLSLDRKMTALGDDLYWVGLRYTNVVGVDETQKGRMASMLSRMARDAAHMKPIVLFSDTLMAARDFVPVALVVESVAAILVGGIPGGIYNLGSGFAVSFAELLQWCAEFLDGAPLDVRLVRNPIPDTYQYWTCADVSKLRSVLPALTGIDREGVKQSAKEIFESHARHRP